MEAFMYLSMMTSIVLGLGVTRLFVGIGTTVEHRKEVRPYGVQLLWSLNLFLFIVLEWWILFRWQDHQNWNFFLFLFLLLSPSISFLLSVILYPTKIEKTDFKQHFFKNRRWFFFLAALLPPLDAADTLLKGYAHFQAQGVIYPLFLAIVFVLTILGAILKNELYHKFFAVFFLLYIVSFIFVNLNLLS
jgi:hypothetical protein